MAIVTEANAADTGEISAEVREAAMRAEPDRYLAATLATRGQRSALAAIAGFAAELVRIPATVSEPALGDIRLQWWRDTLAGAPTGTRSGHRIADAVGNAMLRYNLDHDLLIAMIDARELDLSGGLPQDDAGLEAYLDATEGHPFRLALGIVGVPADLIGPLARPAGLAYGLARNLGRLPMLLHNGGLPLPADRLRAAGVEPNALGAVPASANLAGGVERVADDLAAMAREGLRRVRPQFRTLPRPMRAALLPLAMVEPYFRSQSGRSRLENMGQVTPLARVVRIGMAHLTGRL